MAPKRKSGRKPKKELEKQRFNTIMMRQFCAQMDTLTKKKIMLIHTIEQTCQSSLFQICPNVRDKTLKNLTTETQLNISRMGDDMTSGSNPGTFPLSAANNAASSRRMHLRSLSQSGADFHTIYKTPSVTLPRCNFIITPKINPSSPMGILRVPEQGEFAVSSTGSPLLVTTSTRDDTANINIPLKNGKKMLILPNPNVNTDTIKKNLDPKVKEQLKTLITTLHGIVENTN